MALDKNIKSTKTAKIFRPKYTSKEHHDIIKRNNEIYHFWLHYGFTPNRLSQRYGISASAIRKIIIKARPFLKSKIS